MSRKAVLTEEEKKRRAFNSKERYYKPSRRSKRGWYLWTEEEIELILKREHSDRELAEMLERSVMSIQVKRCVVRKLRDAENLSRV